MQQKLKPLGHQASTSLNILIHHDEDAEIYINGQLVMTLTSGFTNDYVAIPLNK